ncbi:hypothetical protein BCL79_2365 [Stenotrophomonas rhizophila]|uniref:Uncharacterized protein n=1 Tax=Stenotrophomonas rhizophila TaxID=216778 RepID=A0A498CBS4_9GAMM|nr:hypothetical protein [Stenotrophomonas rhizophila]RLK53075.1 hypothetical protein BCL79_2365 [Stenotrophomonas rhizophila]
MSLHRCLHERVRRALPARLEVASLLEGEASGWPSPLRALPGVPAAPGLLRFGLAPATCEAITVHGLRFLEQARQARGRLPLPHWCGDYRPWREGAQALREIGIRGLPAGWPAHAAVYASASEDRSRWLLILPGRGQLWYGWMA